jgi:uncharacterized protein
VRLVDVNVLIYAFREDSPGHAEYRDWLNGLVSSHEAYAVSDHVLSGFIRIATHPRVFHPPTPIERALAFTEAYRDRPNAVLVAPGDRHWDLFTQLCRKAGARGNLAADAWIAALAIERGCELMTTDRDFARFHGLRWRHPLHET